MSSKKSIYKELAEYYDLLYSYKKYKAESAKIHALIKKYKKSNDNTLLEVACGTGQHVFHLQNQYGILATDINKDMLAVAKRKNPSVAFKQADMIDLNLNKKFDVILCLFSSIGYVKSYKNLIKTISNFANHLKKGGVVIIEPWFTWASYLTGLPTMTTYNGDNIKIARLCVCEKRGIVSIMNMHYLIAEQDKKIKHFVDRHELAMFEIDRVLEIMEANGLAAKFLKNGLIKDRGLYVGVKR